MIRRPSAVATQLLADALATTSMICGCARMWFKCFVSDAVSCLPLGQLSQARARLTCALSSNLARAASVLSSLLQRETQLNG